MASAGKGFRRKGFESLGSAILQLQDKFFDMLEVNVP